jgi:hypothetical protein
MMITEKKRATSMVVLIMVALNGLFLFLETDYSARRSIAVYQR